MPGCHHGGAFRNISASVSKRRWRGTLGNFALKAAVASLTVKHTLSAILNTASGARTVGNGKSFAVALPLNGLLVSTIVSAGVIAGSLLGKLPHVYAICKARSADGLSAVSIWADEVTSLGIQLAYNVVRPTALSTDLEVPILFVQLILLAIVAAWGDGYLGKFVWSGVVALIAGTLMMALGIVPAVVAVWLYAANTVFGIAICAPQVVMKWRNRSTGRLSLAVSAMTFGGLTSRLFTTWVKVQDMMLLLSVGLNWLLMAMLMSQFVLYHPANDADNGMPRCKSMVIPVYLLGNVTAEDSFTLESFRHKNHEKMRSLPCYGDEELPESCCDS